MVEESAISAGLPDDGFRYGDDIDTTEALDHVEVYATANVTRNGCADKPVIADYTPNMSL